jgi:SAM-dependent methyltransferase
MLDKTSEYLKMAEVETEFWWYKALHYRIVKEIKKNFSDRKDISILDSGCGTGGLMLYLRKRNYSSITGFDLSPLALDFCRKKDLNVTLEDVYCYRENNTGKTYDVIISSDILCYIELDKHDKIIYDLYEMLNPGGILLINLPAFNIFKGEHDIAVGLLRRYNLSVVKRLFKPYQSKIYCWPFLLSPLIMTGRIIQKIKLLFTKSPGVKSDVDIPHHFLNSLFYRICKLESDFLPYLNWGSSIFIRIKKA